jgi:hypothetical protein
MDDEYYALILRKQESDKYIFEQVPVEKGMTIDGYTTIVNSNDFNETDEFLTHGAFNLIKEGGGGHNH